MSIPIAGRYGALVALMAISFSCAVAQEKLPCEHAPKDWPVHHTGAIVDDISGCCSDLADLAQRSEIIVRGEVTDCIGRLSQDKREVWTDYTISIQEIFRQAGKSSLAPGTKIQVTRLGGYFLFDDHRGLEYDVGSSPIPEEISGIFFFGPCNFPDCTTGYQFAVGVLGTISLENGQVSCSAKPHRVWKPYCGTTASSFISTLKQKVPSSDYIYKYGFLTTLEGTLIERKVNGASEDGETPSKDGQDNILVLQLEHPITVEPPADAKSDVSLEVARDIREVQLFVGHSPSAEVRRLVGEAVVATGALKKVVAPSENTKVWFDIIALHAK